MRKLTEEETDQINEAKEIAHNAAEKVLYFLVCCVIVIGLIYAFTYQN